MELVLLPQKKNYKPIYQLSNTTKYNQKFEQSYQVCNEINNIFNIFYW